MLLLVRQGGDFVNVQQVLVQVVLAFVVERTVGALNTLRWLFLDFCALDCDLGQVQAG